MAVWSPLSCYRLATFMKSYSYIILHNIYYNIKDACDVTLSVIPHLWEA
jgi:hypothetical protein